MDVDDENRDDGDELMECVKCYAEISIHEADDGMCQSCIDKINNEDHKEETLKKMIPKGKK